MAHAPKSPEQKQRLAAALRENLKRRKARARVLAADAEGEKREAAPRPANAAKQD